MYKNLLEIMKKTKRDSVRESLNKPCTTRIRTFPIEGLNERITTRVDKVNETINSICIWIQEQLDNDMSINRHEVSEMVKALAELVSASASRMS